MKRSAKQSVFIVDDHPMMRRGLAQFLMQEAGLEVCGEANDAREAAQRLDRLKPDLVILDISLPGKNGLELIKELRVRHPDLKILVHSMHDERIFVPRVLRAGAKGYLMKQNGGDELVEAVRTVLAGKIYVPQSLREFSAGGHSNEAVSVLKPLTDRELEVLHLIGSGCDNTDIAQRLHLSTKTVDAHRENMKRKLQLRSSTELNLFAVRWVEADRAGNPEG